MKNGKKKENIIVSKNILNEISGQNNKWK